MADLPPASAPPPTKITVLISGGGTNLQALIDASASGLLPSASIIRVFSNIESAGGLVRAQKANIPTTYHNLYKHGYCKKGENDPNALQAAREEYCADLAKLVLADGPDIVVCAGWMLILTPTFLDPLAAARVPIINLHPALPGEYDGKGAIERAYSDFHNGKLKNGRTGVMVHYVVKEVDRGQPILVREIECRQGEELEGLESRIHKVEHEVIVAATGLAIAMLWEERRALGGNRG